MYIKAITACFLAPKTIAWCAHVTVAPDVNKSIVFSKGTFQGSNIVKNTGGHTPPKKILGLKLE